MPLTLVVFRVMMPLRPTGPNHLKNNCDANIIVDAGNTLGNGELIKQASFYYMGHFSRYFQVTLPPYLPRISPHLPDRMAVAHHFACHVSRSFRSRA